MRELLVLLGITLAACSSDGSSSSSSTSGAGAGSCTESAAAAPAFSAYCTVQSTVELTVLRPLPPIGWGGKELCMPPGATIYLAAGSSPGTAESFAFVENGTIPAALWVAPVDSEIVAGTHYTGTCPTPSALAPMVVMANATVFPTKEKTGAPCALAPATELADFEMKNEETNLVSVAWTDIQAKCGFDRGFTSDLNVGRLVKK